MKNLRKFTLDTIAWIPLPMRFIMGFARLALAAVLHRNAKKTLASLFRFRDDLDKCISYVAMKSEGGVHPKHRLTRYHDFFVEKIKPGEMVLDIGCGYGAVAFSIASRSGAHVLGVDLDPANIEMAKRKHAHTKILYRVADATSTVFDEKFDTIVMSNVLEHIQDRVGLLRAVQRQTSAKRWLIRVPILERDWMVPMRQELGMEYYLDETHFTEYTVESFSEEMQAAGLQITEMVMRWSEIWAECKAKTN